MLLRARHLAPPVLALALLACGESKGNSSETSASGGSAGTGGSGGAAGSGSGGNGGSIDCSNVGCAPPPFCSEGCTATCGCCGCAEGESQLIGGEPYLCRGGCLAPDPCACPTSPPAPGDSCGASCSQTCAYEDCSAAGLVVATCNSGSFDVTSRACGGQACGEEPPLTCEAGSVCITQFGGALFPPECRPHECGEGAITCACLATSCPGECTRVGLLEFTCDTCPGGGCP